MSYTYYLVCIETKQVLGLGKIVSIDIEGDPIPWRFSAYGTDIATGQKLTRQDKWNLVDRFLILNRNYEIRVLPYSYLEELDPDGVLFEYFYTVEDLMSKPVEPEPDPERDSALVPESVRKKLLD